MTNYINEAGIKRYNQGFAKFGPMEQCDTGEWVKAEEAEVILKAAALRTETAIEDARLEGFKKDVSDRASDYWKEKFNEKWDDWSAEKRRADTNALYRTLFGLVAVMELVAMVVLAGMI